ncbi:MAG: hemin uptake protein HemP [Pseudomonadota bacterium]
MVTDVPKTATLSETPLVDTYNARDLIKDGVHANIILDGQIYVLRITRAGKLILTK